MYVSVCWYRCSAGCVYVFVLIGVYVVRVFVGVVFFVLCIFSCVCLLRVCMCLCERVVAWRG